MQITLHSFELKSPLFLTLVSKEFSFSPLLFAFVWFYSVSWRDLCCRRGKFHIRQLFQPKKKKATKKPPQINKPLIWRHMKVLQTRSAPCLGFVLLSGSHIQRPAWENQTDCVCFEFIRRTHTENKSV